MAPDLVICRSGTDYAERPLAFDWQGEWLDVARVLQQWRTPGGLHFRILTEDQQNFELYYDLLEDTWQVDQH